MKVLFLFILIVAFFFVTLFIWNSFQRKKGISGEKETDKPLTDGECCGQHAICEKDSLITGFTQEPEYFDDEELDRFSGIPSDRYSDTEVEEFREIFYSMYDKDKPKWIRSLQHRGIAVPDGLKDEIIIFVNELRNTK